MTVETKSLRAITRDTYGPASAVLRLAEIEYPVPSNDEVLVRVHAAAPVIDTSYPLSETQAAIDCVAGGHAHGKVVITV